MGGIRWKTDIGILSGIRKLRGGKKKFFNPQTFLHCSAGLTDNAVKPAEGSIAGESGTLELRGRGSGMHISPFVAKNALKTVKSSTLGKFCNSRNLVFGEQGSCR